MSYSPYIRCSDCGEPVKHVASYYDRSNFTRGAKYACRRCGTSKTINPPCPSCQLAGGDHLRWCRANAQEVRA